MDINDRRVKQALTALLNNTVKESSGIKNILDAAKRGDIDEVEAMKQMMALVQKMPELNTKLMDHAARDLGFLKNDDPVPQIVDAPEGVGDPNTVFQPRPNGLPAINPLYLSHIIERLQFDNDIPELRTGPKEIGVPPAVELDTEVRNPVAVGMMMKQAEKELGEKVDEMEKKRRDQIEAVTQGTSDNLALLAEHSKLVSKYGKENAKEMMLYGSSDTDHPDYRRGQLPSKMHVPVPNAQNLLKIQGQNAQDAVWKMLSSAQGRRTGLTAIRGIIINYLGTKNIHVKWRDYDKTVPSNHIKAAHEWKISITGTRNLQAGFSILDTAGKVLGTELLRQMEGKPVPKDLTLEVTTVDKVATRDVGWAARLISTFKPKKLEHGSKTV